MNTSSETHETLAAHSTAEARSTTAAPRPATTERHPFTALPEGWCVIGRCRFGTGGPGPQATGCYALAHPQIGVALIDLIPNATPNAEARLRRALTSAEFWPDFPGTLPVMHDRVDGMGIRNMPWVLERGFATLPALTVPGGSAWIDGVKRAMATDPAWELLGQPKAAPDAPAAPLGDVDAPAAPPATRAARPRRWGRLATLPLAFAGTFGVGVVAGFLLLDSPSPAPAPTQLAAAPQAAAPSASVPPNATPQAAALQPPAPQVAARPAVSTTAPAPDAAPRDAALRQAETTAAGAPAPAIPATSAAAPPASVEPAPASAPMPTPAPAQQPVPVAAETPAPAPVEPPAVQVAAASAGLGNDPAAQQPLETRVALARPAEPGLPLAPPRAPSPPQRANSAQPSARSAPVVDRACSQALFRFQQGERLTAAEQNFVRSGCSTSRR